MSETGWRLTIGSILSVVWFAIFSGVTDWPVVLVFLAAVACGFLLSVIDLILVGIFSAILD